MNTMSLQHVQGLVNRELLILLRYGGCKIQTEARNKVIQIQNKTLGQFVRS